MLLGGGQTGEHPTVVVGHCDQELGEEVAAVGGQMQESGPPVGWQPPPLQQPPRLQVVDGSSFAATRSIPGDIETPPAEIARRTVADDAVMLVDVCIQWALGQAGAWGEADLVIGLHEVGSGETFRVPMPLVTYLQGDRGQRVSNTRLLTRVPSAVVRADLAAATDTQSRLAVTHVALAALLQWFGVAEPREIGADGTLLVGAWGSGYDVARWAREYGVASQPHRPSSAP